jgi:hypothetical protein
VEKGVWDRVSEKLAKAQAGCGVAAKSSSQAKQIRGLRKVHTAVYEGTEPVPRVTRLLALALKFEGMIRSGVVCNYSVLAQLGEVSRSRLSQITNMLSLAPEIQEEILFLRQEEAERLHISELSIRKLSGILEWGEQRAHWKRLRLSLAGPSPPIA